MARKPIGCLCITTISILTAGACRLWEASWGGSLELHRDSSILLEQDEISSILPLNTLSEDDIQGLRDLLARRDAQISFLYDREMEFQRLAHSPSMRLVRLLTAPLRELRDLRRG